VSIVVILHRPAQGVNIYGRKKDTDDAEQDGKPTINDVAHAGVSKKP
jgi:hypothetical protein